MDRHTHRRRVHYTYNMEIPRYSYIDPDAFLAYYIKEKNLGYGSVRKIEDKNAYRSLETILHSNIRGPVDLLTLSTEVKAASDHIAGEFHVLVDRVIDGLDAVRVINGKFRVPRSLDALRYDTIANAQRIEYELGAVGRTISDQFVLVVEVVEERRTIVATIRFGPQIKGLVLYVAVQLRKSAEETLKHVPSSDSSQICGAELCGIDHGPLARDTIGGIFLFPGKRILAALLFFRVRKSNSEWL